MKQAGKTGGKNKRQTMIDIAGKLGLGGEGREKQDIEYEIDERYDEGGVEDAPKPKFDYTKFFRKRRADGGAIGIEVLFREKKNLGGLLTGQAKSIYDSMTAAGYFTEDEIRNAITNAGYEIPGVSQPEKTAPNIINQDGGEGGPPPPGPKPFDKGFSSLNFGLGPNKDVVDYEAEAYGIGPTFKGTFARAFSALQNIPTPFNIARMGIQKAIEFAKQKEKEKEAQLAAITRDIARDNKAAGTGGYQSSFGQDTGFMGGKGTAAEMGSFKDGGIVSMFVEKK